MYPQTAFLWSFCKTFCETSALCFCRTRVLGLRHVLQDHFVEPSTLTRDERFTRFSFSFFFPFKLQVSVRFRRRPSRRVDRTVPGPLQRSAERAVCEAVPRRTPRSFNLSLWGFFVCSFCFETKRLPCLLKSALHLTSRHVRNVRVS